MRLLLINGNTTQAITDRCAAAARAAARPDTEIVPLTASRGPKIIGTRAENALASAAVIELLAAHAGTADAALIAENWDRSQTVSRIESAYLELLEDILENGERQDEGERGVGHGELRIVGDLNGLSAICVRPAGCGGRTRGSGPTAG